MNASANRGQLTYEFPDMNPRERLRQLILYIARVSFGDERFGKVKLAKILYYADFESFRRFGKPITGAKYVKLPKGPIPDDFRDLLETMLKSHEIVVQEEPYFGFRQQRVIPLHTPDLTKFTGQDIALVDEFIQRFRTMSAADVSDMSHGAAWTVLDLKEAIPYEASILSDKEITDEDIADAEEFLRGYEWDD